MQMPVDPWRYRQLSAEMAEGFCVLELLFDDGGSPQDYVIREVNAAYAEQTGESDPVGRRGTELAAGRKPASLEQFASVARDGNALRFELRSERLGRWYAVRAFRWGEPHQHLVGVLFSDITQRKVDEMMAQSVVEYAIVMLDADGRVRTWNAGAQRIKGYARDEILGKDFSVFYPAEEVAAGKPAQVLALAAESGRFDEEAWRVRRDGSRFWASVAVAPLRDSDGRLQGYVKVTRDLTERKQAQEQLQALNSRLEAEVDLRTQDLRLANGELLDAKERLQELSSRLIRAQEQERGRIARDMHDDIGQVLSLIRMRLAEIGREHASEAVDRCAELVDQVIARARRLALNLRPTILDDLGLDDALQWLLEQHTAAAGWAPVYDSDIGERRFDGDIETACFRIAQEALDNAARHSKAAHASVSLKVEGDRLVLVIADDGQGFDVPRFRSPQQRSDHFGLVSMEERAALVGGRVALDSAPGRGTRVTATFPARA